jgi:steroid delta-isomerase-like uncharacterized protein
MLVAQKARQKECGCWDAWSREEEAAMSVAPAHKLLFGRLYHSVWNERRLEFIDQVIAETHALGDPTVSGRGVGPTAYRRQVERFLKGLPDLKFTVDDTISENDKLVVYWTVSGTHSGELLGVPPTNRKVTFSGISICLIADGKILESTVMWDVWGLLKQMGIDLPVQLEMMAASAG